MDLSVANRLARRALVAALLLAPLVAAAQTLSPGELANPHAHLEGLSNCTKCHAEGKQLSADLCLRCHTDVKKRVAAKTGLHGKLSAESREQCQTCHHEHAGKQAKLIEWGRGVAQFDHNRAGFPLRGKHAGVKCATCHEPRRITDGEVLSSLREHPKKETWLGVSRKCTTCHFDEHRGQEGSDCERCHNELGWKPVPKFDHQKSGFPLRGKHQGVACKQCHTTEQDDKSHPAFPPPLASTYLKLTDLAHQRCTDCHEDPHKGKFGRGCESCHTVEGWMTIKKSSDRAFHDKTHFPLRGAHANVVCTSCHGPFPGKPAKFRGLAYTACSDCHADAHSGQLKAACESCHTVEHFAPSTFQLEDHQKTSYPLAGEHQAVACASCHLPSGPSKLAKADAEASKPAKPTKPDKRNQRGKQGKRGKDAKATPPKPASAMVLLQSAWRFTLGKAKPDKTGTSGLERCESCHADPHGGQLAAAQDGCRHCHSVESFTKVTFSHDESRFPLTGKHKQAECGQCHAPNAGSGASHGRPLPRFRPVTQECQGCHRDVHYGQLRAQPCTRCHTTEAFSPSLFSHDDRKLTDYALEGKHRSLACAACHKPIQTSSGAKVVRYKPVPRACEGCHDDFHKGDFRGFTP